MRIKHQIIATTTKTTIVYIKKTHIKQYKQSNITVELVLKTNYNTITKAFSSKAHGNA